MQQREYLCYVIGAMLLNRVWKQRHSLQWCGNYWVRRIALVKRMHELRVVLVIQKCMIHEESGVFGKSEGCNISTRRSEEGGDEYRATDVTTVLRWTSGGYSLRWSTDEWWPGEGTVREGHPHGGGNVSLSKWNQTECNYTLHVANVLHGVYNGNY